MILEAKRLMLHRDVGYARAPIVLYDIYAVHITLGVMPMTVRPARDVAKRLLILIAITEAANQQPPVGVRDWLSKHDLNNALSAREQEFLSHDKAADHFLAAASWRMEACAVLAWALSLISVLPPATEQTSWDAIGVGDTILSDPSSLVANASLRPTDELSSMQREIERQHWSIRAGSAGRRLFSHSDSAENLNSSVIYERHYAMFKKPGPSAMSMDAMGNASAGEPDGGRRTTAPGTSMTVDRSAMHD